MTQAQTIVANPVAPIELTVVDDVTNLTFQVSIQSLADDDLSRLNAIDVSCTEAKEASATSATTASTKAIEATTSATTAINKAAEAAASADSVKGKAEESAASATTSAAKAAEAAASATTASTKASESATSATTATTKANEASSSATTATTKANEASSSATLASGKTSEAAVSATTAASKAAEAVTAASTIGTSVETAAASATTATEKAAAAAASASSLQGKVDEAAASAASAATKASESSAKASDSITKAGEAAASASTATIKANESAASATTASTKATESAASATTAANKESKAQQWADNPKNSEVEPGKFSAKHWAALAKEDAAPITNAFIFRGSWDASQGAPTTPSGDSADIYEISVAGTINSVKYGVDDYIFWNPTGREWLKIGSGSGSGSGSGREITDALDNASSVIAASAKAVKTLNDNKANTSHNQAISTITGLQTSLNSKAGTSHNHTTLNGVTKINFQTDHSDEAYIGTKVTGSRSFLDFCVKDDADDGYRWRYNAWRAGSPTYQTLMTLGPRSVTSNKGDLNVTGHITAADGFIGNATTATHLLNSRTLSLTGDVSGSTSFNGAANASITATVENNSHNHTLANITNLETSLSGKEPTLPDDRKRKITISQSDPSGGSNGDIWIRY